MENLILVPLALVVAVALWVLFGALRKRSGDGSGPSATPKSDGPPPQEPR